MQVDQSGVSGEFPLATTTTVTQTHAALGFEVTVSYSVTPEENYAGPPGSNSTTKPPVS